MILKGIKQGTPKWHAERLKGIGASEVSALFEMDHPGYAMSAYTLAKVKRGEIPAESVFAGDKHLANMGLALEDGIAKGHAKARGWKIKPGGYVVDDLEPRMRASMDYIIQEPTEMDLKELRGIKGPGALQIKSVIGFQFRRLWTEQNAPMHVIYQLQCEMAAAGFEWGAIGACINGLVPAVYLFKANRALGDKMRRNIAGFWDRCVIGGEVPPVDGSESTRLCLRQQFLPRMFDRDMHDRESDVELDDAATDYDIAVAQFQAAERNKDLARNRLTALMGTSTNAYSSHWFIKNWVSEKQRRLTVSRRTSNQGHIDG